MELPITGLQIDRMSCHFLAIGNEFNQRVRSPIGSGIGQIAKLSVRPSAQGYIQEALY